MRNSNKPKKKRHEYVIEDTFDFDNSLIYIKNVMTNRKRQDNLDRVAEIRKESVIALGAIACIVFLEGVVYAVASFLWM